MGKKKLTIEEKLELEYQKMTDAVCDRVQQIFNIFDAPIDYQNLKLNKKELSTIRKSRAIKIIFETIWNNDQIPEKLQIQEGEAKISSKILEEGHQINCLYKEDPHITSFSIGPIFENNVFDFTFGNKIRNFFKETTDSKLVLDSWYNIFQLLAGNFKDCVRLEGYEPDEFFSFENCSFRMLFDNKKDKKILFEVYLVFDDYYDSAKSKAYQTSTRYPINQLLEYCQENFSKMSKNSGMINQKIHFVDISDEIDLEKNYLDSAGPHLSLGNR